MKVPFKFRGLIVLPFLLYGCIYENDGSYFSPVKPPDPSLTQVALASIGNAPLYKPVLITLNVTPSDKGDYTAIVNVDGITVATPKSYTGTIAFVLDTQPLSDGEHTLKLTVYFPSLSPSLAGQLGVEYIQSTSEYKFTVDKAPPAQIKAPRVYIEDGKSMVAWTKPEKFNFSELVLLRMYYKNGSHLDTDTIKISDPATEVYHDATYVGGDVRYRVDIKGYQYVLQGQETSFMIDAAPFTISENSGSPLLIFAKSPLYNNSIRMDVFYGSTYRMDQENSINANVRFGQPNIVPVTVYPMNIPSGQQYYRYSFNIPVRAGKTVPAFDFVKYIEPANAYLMSKESTIYKVDATTFQLLSSMSVSRDVGLVSSQDGMHVYAYGYDQLFKIDPINLAVTSTVNFTSLVGFNQGFMYAPSVSNGNILAIALYAQPKLLIDMNTQTVIASKSGYGQPHLSPDGLYLALDKVIYQKVNDNWNTVLTTVAGSDIYSISFRQDSKNELIVVNNGKLEVYDFPSMTQKTLPLIAGFPLMYDSDSEQYFTLSGSGSTFAETKVFDANTYEQIGTPVTVYDTYQVRFQNRHFFHQSGSVIPNL